jgi:hypothetical protein
VERVEAILAYCDFPWLPCSPSRPLLLAPLAPPGSSWLLLAPAGFSWLLLAPAGSSWLLLPALSRLLF